jgi:bifunctional UDP-N-acetylglucosamine pyrophosphorylase/glucosamine-1-phosphate N-acetyltransferase
MKSARPKVVHRIAGLPMIDHVLDTASALAPATTTVVVGHRAEDVQRALGGRPASRSSHRSRSSGRRTRCSAPRPLSRARRAPADASGDVPLLSQPTLERLRDRHPGSGAHATVLTATVANPFGYGRIVRTGEKIARIVEEKDATATERAITEINAGIYIFALDGLFQALKGIASANAQQEYYLPDLVSIYRAADWAWKP